MSIVTIGLLVSFFFTLAFYALVSYEERTGNRLLHHVRAYADVRVLTISRSMHETFNFVARDLIRQLARYAFHTVLSTILVLIRKFEGALRNAIRTNKTLATSVDEDRDTRTKLEEVAFHRATNALTEEEKKLHRDKMLEG